MDRDTWRFINTFSGWLSAIGTLVAVTATIYLSRRDKQIRLTVRASKGVFLQPGEDTRDVIWIAVRNIGIRSAYVSNIYWKVGVWSRANFCNRLRVIHNHRQFPSGSRTAKPLITLFRLSNIGERMAQGFARSSGLDGRDG
jgi:hypothetical protein